MSARKNTFVDRLKRISEGLPSTAEKDEIRDNIQQIIEYLHLLNEAVNSFPTTEDTQKIRERLDDIQGKLDSHKGGNLIGAIAGFRRVQGQPRKQVSHSDLEHGRRDLENLSKMGVDDLRSSLKNEKEYSLGRIRVILAALGVRVSSRKIRAELADLLVTKITNYKGYEMLRNENKDK